MNDWQPIETAPKDGRELLLWCGWAIAGFWIENGKRVNGGWSEDDSGVNPIYMVTHWMPLPAPPKEDK